VVGWNGAFTHLFFRVCHPRELSDRGWVIQQRGVGVPPSGGGGGASFFFKIFLSHHHQSWWVGGDDVEILKK